MSKMLDEIMEFAERYGDFPVSQVSKGLRMNIDFEQDGVIIKSFRIPRKVSGTKLKQESWDWRCKAYPPDIYENKEEEVFGASMFFWREKDEILKTSSFARKYIVDEKLVTHRELSAAYQHPSVLKTSFGVNLKVGIGKDQHVLIMWVCGK